MKGGNSEGEEDKGRLDAEGAVERGVVHVPKEQRVAAVITVSEFGECCENGVKSVLDNAAYFRELHIVQHGHANNMDIYPGWAVDAEAVAGAFGVPPIWHSTFDPNKVRAGAVVYIAPDMQVASGAIAELHQQMVHCSVHDPHKTHFAITGITSIRLDTEAEKRDPRNWLQGLSYGFLLVVMMLDWMRSLFALYKYHRTFDLRAELLFSTFPRRVRCAPKRPFTWWVRNVEQARTEDGGAALLHIPRGGDAGLSFVLRTIKTHNHLGAGLWVLGFALYYVLFAWPWWNGVALSSSVWGWPILYPITKNPWAWYWMLLYVVHTLVVALVAWTCVEIPLAMLPAQVLAYTVYLTLSPAILLYGRFHMSRAAWRHFRSGRGGGPKKGKKNKIV